MSTSQDQLGTDRRQFLGRTAAGAGALVGASALDAIVPSLAALRKRGLKLTVVSNANGRLKVLFDRLELSACVDCLLDYHDEGVEQPDPRYFEIALERSGARRDTTIHVGDLYHVDVIGARNAGLRAVLLDEAGLYPDADCPRVGSLTEFVNLICTGAFD